MTWRPTVPTLLAAAAAVLALLAGCATAPGGSGSAGGAVTFRPTDTRIWALDYATALRLLAIGVVPEHAARYRYQPDPIVTAAYQILQDAGVTLVEPSNVELVAAATPDLIIGESGTDTELVARLEQLAPVLVVDGMKPLAAQLADLGAATGHAEQAELLTERLETLLAEMKRRVTASEHAGATVSVISACGAGGFCTYGADRGFGPILRELGFRRPPSQSGRGNEFGYSFISPEELSQQAADVVIDLQGSVAFGGTSPLDDPLLDTSGSVTGRVDFNAWYGTGPLHTVWVLHDLDAVLFGEGATATAEDGPTLWATVIGAA
jgi:iron complex transport system substrate-binding protein